MDASRKRGRPGNTFFNGGLKKSRQEMDSLAAGVGSKSKPCTKFFSMAGCPFGEGCHFMHYAPGGYNAVSQIMNKPPTAPKPKIVPPNQPVPNGSTPPAIKTRMCSKYNTAEGCKYGDKCHFAHGEWDLGRPAIPPHNDHNSMTTGSLPVHILTHTEPPRPAPILGFGDTVTAKVSIDASLAGSIIGKGGVNSKQICGQTGAKLSIREHETDPNLRNIELEGTFEQIGLASTMLKELIASIVPGAGGGGGGGHLWKSSGVSGEKPHPGNCYKTKMCDNFVKGSCSFGQRCHFAHGAAEVRKTGV